jgi:hypothetical protein
LPKAERTTIARRERFSLSQRPPGSFTQATATGFVDLIIDGHRETWPLRSKRFFAWLREHYYERTWDALLKLVAMSEA